MALNNWGSLGRCFSSDSDHFILRMGCAVPVRCKVASRWFPWQGLANRGCASSVRFNVIAKPLYGRYCVGTETLPAGLKSCCWWQLQNYSWRLKHADLSSLREIGACDVSRDTRAGYHHKVPGGPPGLWTIATQEGRSSQNVAPGHLLSARH